MTLNVQNGPQQAGNAWWDSLPEEVKRAISYANSTPPPSDDHGSGPANFGQVNQQPGQPVPTQPPPAAVTPAMLANGGSGGGGGASAGYMPSSQPSQGGGYGVSPPGMPVVPSGSTPQGAIDAGGHPNYGPAGSNMPWPSQVNPSGIPWTSQHPAATAIAANATPGGRDITVRKAAPAAAKNPFTQIASPNTVGMGGALGRGGARPMMSALDLSSLFGNHPNPA